MPNNFSRRLLKTSPKTSKLHKNKKSIKEWVSQSSSQRSQIIQRKYLRVNWIFVWTGSINTGKLRNSSNVNCKNNLNGSFKTTSKKISVPKNQLTSCSSPNRHLVLNQIETINIWKKRAILRKRTQSWRFQIKYYPRPGQEIFPKSLKSSLPLKFIWPKNSTEWILKKNYSALWLKKGMKKKWQFFKRSHTSSSTISQIVASPKINLSNR